MCLVRRATPSGHFMEGVWKAGINFTGKTIRCEGRRRVAPSARQRLFAPPRQKLPMSLIM